MDIFSQFFPNRTVRFAINFGNAVLAQRLDAEQATGISVQLAHTLCQNLGLTPQFVYYNSAGAVVADADKNRWDVAFLARDPMRTEHIAFTSPYVVIHGTYLVNTESDAQFVDDLDAQNKRISVGKGAAYDLYLTRTLTQASLVRAPTTPAAVDYFIEQNLDAAAGVRGPLLEFAKAHPDYRVLADNFMSIEQAVAFNRQYAPLREALEAQVQRFIQSGAALKALAESGQCSAQVAPLNQDANYTVL